MRGAEAILSKSFFEGKSCLIKDRIPKSYRVKELDVSLRKRRTRREAKLLKKAKEGGIPCPEVLEIEKFKLKISYLEGERAKESENNLKNAAKLLAKLHSLDIIHGDFTLANLLLVKGKMFVIDFGLGSFSHKIEHKAVDVSTMLLSLHGKKHRELFLKSYLKNSKDSEKIQERLERISQRIRYS